MKGNKGVSLVGVVITILVIMLILSVGVCVYLIQNPVKENIVAQNPEQVTTANSSSEVKDEVIKNTELTSNERYNIWVQNVVKELRKAKNDVMFQNVTMSNDKVCEVGLTSKGVLYLTLENQGSREVDKGVVSFEICDVGNGGYKAAYYIKEDGTVSYIVLDEYAENDGVKPVNERDAKNIVSIINNTNTDEPSWASEVLLIDIDGNIYK